MVELSAIGKKVLYRYEWDGWANRGWVGKMGRSGGNRQASARPSNTVQLRIIRSTLVSPHHPSMMWEPCACPCGPYRDQCPQVKWKILVSRPLNPLCQIVKRRYSLPFARQGAEARGYFEVGIGIDQAHECLDNHGIEAGAGTEQQPLAGHLV
jgi:hypothetical protein